jgi:23S rRNA (uridine2552-2'-O)-methyltransferase
MVLNYDMKAKGKRWEDHYSRQAKKERFPARSVFKLKEIQQKHRLIQPGDRVLDLGCSPGAWLLYAASMVGKHGRVIGIDLKPVEIPLPSTVQVYAGDVLSLTDQLLKMLGKDFNAVISDLAPATTGIGDVDAARSYTLCKAALSLAADRLLPGGSFLCKIFQGEDVAGFSDRVKKSFEKQKIFKPRSSRKASREIYIIGRGKKG